MVTVGILVTVTVSVLLAGSSSVAKSQEATRVCAANTEKSPGVAKVTVKDAPAATGPA